MFRITEYSEAMAFGKVVKTVERVYFASESELINLAWYYLWNSDVTEEIDLDNLQNAIEFVERVDKVEKLIVDVYGVYSSEFDMTTIFEDISLENGDSISTELKGFYYGEPCDEDNMKYYGKLKIDWSI